MSWNFASVYDLAMVLYKQYFRAVTFHSKYKVLTRHLSSSITHIAVHEEHIIHWQSGQFQSSSYDTSTFPCGAYNGLVSCIVHQSP